MPYAKISATTKQQALDKLRSGMSATDAARMFDVSVDSLKRWASKQSGKASSQGRKTLLASSPSMASNPSEDATQDNANIPQDKTTLDFADSPDPVEKKSIVDSAFASLKGMLGIPDTQEQSPRIFSAKLDEKQQRFVNATTPTAALAIMSIAAYLWGRIGPEYAQLAPDDKVAQQIVEPLLRVYARHANFLVDVNPDLADVGASIFALVGYVNVSLRLYQRIKEHGTEDYEDYEEVRASRRRDYRRSTASAESENGAGHAGGGSADVWGRQRQDDHSNSNNGRHTTGINQPALTDKEARQYAALSRLSELDYQHRARRSMRSA